MFQVEGTRSVAVHPLGPATSPLSREASGVLAEHLDTLLGERLLPLRLRAGDEDEPYLLAVDAAGQPVVVEIVAVLDEVAVLRALRHAGRAAGMSAQDLASAYRGGATRFAAHLAAFRASVPATTLLPTTVRSGARLLLVCSAIADGIQDVVEFLLQPGWQVDILQVAVVPGADGARIVDVHPLTRTPPPRRALEPTTLRVVHQERVVRPDDAASPWAARPSATGQPHHGPRLSTPPAGEALPGHHGPRGQRPATQPQQMLRPDPARRMPAVVPPAFAVRAATPAGGVPSLGGPAPVVVADAHRGGGDDAARPGPQVPGRTAPDDAHVATPASEAPAPTSLPYAFTGVAPATADDGPHPDLALVAAYLRAPAALVWSRERRGELYEAMLHEDGWLELADGSRFRDPDAAAEAVSLAETHVDGWSVWRLDRPTGRSLAELRDRAAGTRD